MSYDPTKCGAKCGQCPLQGNDVVPPEIHDGASIALIGEAPGEHEEREGRPFVGPSGNELMVALRQAGLRRQDFLWTNVLLCRPPGNDLGALLDKVRREKRKVETENRKRKKEGVGLLAIPRSPVECCMPRLTNEVGHLTDFVTAGGTATKAIIGSGASIMSVRGGMTELNAARGLPDRRVLPTIHPAFVLRQKRWAHVLRNDIDRAARWFRGQLDWAPPIIRYNPSPDELRSFLSDSSVPYWTYDIETDAIECLTATIRCIAIGTPEVVAVIGFVGIDGNTLFYTPNELEEVKEILRGFFTDPEKVKVGHNAGYYDQICCEHHLGITPAPLMDTMMLHRLVESELPHSLGFVGSMYTDAPSWKTDREGRKLSHQSETDAELHEYCALDVAVTARVLPKLYESVQLRDQAEVYKVDQRIQQVCADMHTVGMYVDQDVRLQEEKAFLKERYDRLQMVRGISGNSALNPGSVPQLRRLLFEEWELEAPLEDQDRFTRAGDPSTSDHVLRSLMTIKTLTDQQREFITHLRRYRKCQKLLGTYIVKLRLSDEDADLGWDDEENEWEHEARQRYGQTKRGITDVKTGRCHPGYNAHVTTSGRLSSSKPVNAQNFPKALRSMVCAAPGHVLVGADADQLELRIAAARWNVNLYLKAFLQGKDPHSMTAFAVFGERFCKAAGVDALQFQQQGKLVGPSYNEKGVFCGKGEARALRNLSKGVQYASQYMGSVETVHRLISQTEIENPDGTTTLPYLKLALREVRSMRDNWLSGAPEFESGWETEIRAWKDRGFLTEDVTGRRRDFLDGENVNEIVNFPIQSSAAGLMNLAMLRLYDEIPLHRWGRGTGIINQCHDSIVVECPESEAGYVASLLEEVMNQEHHALPGVRFTATATIGHTWKETG